MAEQRVVVGVFGDAERARVAVEQLRQAGVEGVDIGMAAGGDNAPVISGLLEGLGMSSDDAGRYADAVPSDGALVALRTDEHADEAREILARGGAERVEASSSTMPVVEP